MKPDFEKAAKEHANLIYPCDENFARRICAKADYLQGCEHAYSIDKETIERLEKQKEELKELLHLTLPYLEEEDHELKAEINKASTPDN